jgi:hypothetical protein
LGSEYEDGEYSDEKRGDDFCQQYDLVVLDEVNRPIYGDDDHMDNPGYSQGYKQHLAYQDTCGEFKSPAHK